MHSEGGCVGLAYNYLPFGTGTLDCETFAALLLLRSVTLGGVY